MRRIAWVLVTISIGIAVLFSSVWGAFALLYRLPLEDVWRGLIGTGFFLIGLGTVVALFGRWRLRALVGYLVALVVLLGWWSTITPRAHDQWAPDVARQATGMWNGDILTLSNVRSFEWRSDTNFTEHWETRTYDLSKLATVDMFMSYWAGPDMAHFILSFGFQDGTQLAWSIEVRRRVGGAFSPVADLFKSNPLVIIAADERDVVGVRTNVRGEDVQLYRLKAPPQLGRVLLHQYVSDANTLAEQPKFYNSITTNCTTTVFTMIRAAGDRLPFDWRLIVNGYLPEYAYDQGALDTSLPVSQLRVLSHIDEKARADGLSPDFSKAIRAGVPSPN